MSITDRRQFAKGAVRVGILFYVGWFGAFAIIANLSGENQATITLAYSTISGIILALYSIVEDEKQLPVVFAILVSILLSLTSSVVSLDRASLITGNFAGFPAFSKAQFVVSTLLFAGTTYYFVSSISMQQFRKKPSERKKG